MTHGGNFHPDDVFAVASFQLLLGVENVEVIRTRDDEVIASGDYVVDVGAVYDHDAKRYDHHQNGAPVRDNGIPYAGFGLMWKHYGAEICDSEEIAQSIEERICQPIDAGDNGVNLYELSDLDVRPYELFGVVSSFRPNSKNPDDLEQSFLQATEFARGLILRHIAHSKESLRLEAIAEKVYEEAEDKSLLILEESLSENYFVKYPEVLAIVYPSVDPSRGEVWKVGLITTRVDTFERRVSFPAEWSGLRDEELAKVTGMDDALFCHKNLFRFVSVTKESAIKAAKSAK